MVYIRKPAGSKGTSNSTYKRPALTSYGRLPQAPKSASRQDINERQFDLGGRKGLHLTGGGPGSWTNPSIPSAASGLFNARPPIDPGSDDGGGGGGRSGGGGGGGGGVSPALANAMKAVWEGQLGNAVNLNQGYDDYEGRLRQAYDPARMDKVFDTAQTGVQDASKAGLDRLAPILQGLNDRAAQARTGVNDAFQAGEDRLAALQGQFGGRAQAATGSLNNVLAGFDAGALTGTADEGLTNLFGNARVANERFRTVNDVGLADRPAMYEALNADVTSGIGRDEAGLLNRIAMQRGSAGAQNEQALNLALAQAGLGRLTAQQQRQKEQDQLRLELAQLGLTPPSSFTGSWS